MNPEISDVLITARFAKIVSLGGSLIITLSSEIMDLGLNEGDVVRVVLQQKNDRTKYVQIEPLVGGAGAMNDKETQAAREERNAAR